MSTHSRYIGQVLHDTYRLERLIGRGGMGAVFEASHLRLPRRFAVKLLFADLDADPQAVDRFRHEAFITSQLGHPNIVEVVDFHHTAEGEPYIVMELLRGQDLGARMRKAGPMALPEVAAILEQATSALQAAHDLGVIHRDLKPSNIFLCPQERASGQRVKVVDFGIAKVLGSSHALTRSKAVIGTPWYLSPERARGETDSVDHRSDIFSLGALVYEMLAGRHPFSGDDPSAVVYQVIHVDPPPLESLRKDVPVAVGAVVRRALAKKPAERHASMEELWQDFSMALAGEGSGPRPAVPRSRVPDDTMLEPGPPASLRRGPDTGPPAPVAPPNMDEDRVSPSSETSPTGPRATTEPRLPPATPMTDLVPLSELGLEQPPERATETVYLLERPTTQSSSVGEVQAGPSASGRRRSRRLLLALVLLPVLAGVAVTIWATRTPSPGSPIGQGNDSPESSGARPQMVAQAPRPATESQPLDPFPAEEIRLSSPDASAVVADASGSGSFDSGAGEVASRTEEPAREPARPTRRTARTPASAPARPAPRRPHAAPARTPQGFGQVRVAATCGGSPVLADVLLDGAAAGQTPALLTKVPAGTHVLKATCQGYTPVTRKVTVKPGKTVDVVLKMEAAVPANSDWVDPF